MHKASEKSLLTLIETSKANDMPLAMSLATMSDDSRPDENKQFALEAALTLVKAAGFRVVKPRQRQYRRKGKNKDRVGPTFVCEFSDGTVTRMTTFTSLEALDWERGERLSQAAWGSRWRARARQERGLPITSLWGPSPPAIVSARFEQDGKVLGTRP